MRLERRWRGRTQGTKVTAVGWSALATGGLSIEITVPPHSDWRGCAQVQPIIDGVVGPADYPSDQPVEHAEPLRRLRQWRRDSPVVRTDHVALGQLITQTQEDLGALRIFDPQHPDRVAVAAGAPWFMTVFGRDSLLTAWMALPLDQTLAVGTLRTLAETPGLADSDAIKSALAKVETAAGDVVDESTVAVELDRGEQLLVVLHTPGRDGLLRQHRRDAVVRNAPR